MRGSVGTLTEWVGAVARLDVGEHAEGEQHGGHHGGVAHPARLLPPAPLRLHLLSLWVELDPIRSDDEAAKQRGGKAACSRAERVLKTEKGW
jgi:hypothetical protein